MLSPGGTPRYRGDTHTHAAPGQHCTRTRSKARQSWFQITSYACSSGHPLGAHDVYLSPSQCANCFKYFCRAATTTHSGLDKPVGQGVNSLYCSGQKMWFPSEHTHTHTHTMRHKNKQEKR